MFVQASVALCITFIKFPHFLYLKTCANITKLHYLSLFLLNNISYNINKYRVSPNLPGALYPSPGRGANILP